MKPVHFALAILIILIWGCNWVMIKLGLDEIPPFLLGAVRFFLTSIPGIFLVKRPAVPFKKVIWYGLVMFALQFGFLFLGMVAGIAPGLASILVQINVFFSILLGVWIFDEKIRSWQIVGACIAFSGIALVAYHIGGSATWLGFALVIASAISWGAGNVISKKIGKVNMVSLVIWGSLVAWPPLLLASFLLDGSDKILFAFQHLTWLSGAAALYITYLSTLFGFSAWSWLLHHHPMGRIAPFTLAVPVIALLTSAILLDEPLQAWKICAGILVIGGLAVNLLVPCLKNP